MMNGETDGGVVEQARELARTAHAGQIYQDGPFFQRHLARVVETLRSFGEERPELLAAAWLHDIVEDTDATVDQLSEAVGPEIGELVYRLTDETGGNRGERQTRTHAKLRADPRAVRVKLADRIANVEASIEGDPPLLGMYRKEYPKFRADLYRPGEHEQMWERLDTLLDGPPARGSATRSFRPA